ATPGRPMSREVGYGIEDVWDEMIRDMKERTSTITQLTAALRRIQTIEDREPARTDDPEDAGRSSILYGILSIIGVADALEEIEANRTSRNGDDKHDLGTEFVFHNSNCTFACQIKSSTCTLLGSALTWWNSYVKTVSHDVAYRIPWKTLKKMITAKYCLRDEIKKHDIELWNMKVKDEVKKYVGALPDMIQGSVMDSKPKRMHDAIEFSTELMDQKIRSLADHQAEKKRKFDDTLRNNQNQQQPFKRHNVARAYTAGHGEKKVYRGSKPLCHKYNYHHDG
ncbi:hypothetical protein Tco_0424523, partial [Tanacetum coccineum]